VSKHIIFLKESSDAVLLTLKNLSMHHQIVLNDTHNNWRRRGMNDMTQRMLRYVENEFETVNLRLQSLEKRMQNVIALVSVIFVSAKTGVLHKPLKGGREYIHIQNIGA